MTGLIAGSGGPSTSAMLTAHQTVLSTGATKRIGPFAVPKCMSSTVSANLATAYRIKGMNFSITSACSTSLHCIGMAAQQVALGNQDIMFAGGGEELDWTLSCLFDAMGAMSSKFNDTPERASRAFDADRDGFVISGGGAMVVLEPLDRAVARGAKIYAEVTGFAATSDGADMVAPSGEGGERAMRGALRTLPEGRRSATSTPTAPPRRWATWARSRRCAASSGGVDAPRQFHQVDDRPCAGCGRRARGDLLPPDAEGRFHRPLDQCRNPRPGAQARGNRDETVENAGLDTVMTNSFGFGGTNGSMLLSRYDG
jgi:3-oxoacyl-[acyl-carrier-protein] synthase-1